MSNKSEDKLDESKTLKKSTKGAKKIEKEKKGTSIITDEKEVKSKKNISKIKTNDSSVTDNKKKKQAVEVIKPVKSEVKEKLVVIKGDKEAEKKKQITTNELKEKKSILQIPKSIKKEKIDNLLEESSKNEKIKRGKIETVNSIPHAVVLISKGNIKRNRKGRGFSLSELKVIGLDRTKAQKLGLSVDIRRSTGLLENVKLLKKWLAPSLEVITRTKSKSASSISN